MLLQAAVSLGRRTLHRGTAQCDVLSSMLNRQFASETTASAHASQYAPAQPSDRADAGGSELVSSADDFLSSLDYPPADLPGNLETFRRSNMSMPYLEGQMVQARVIAVDRHTVLLDPGYKFTQRFFKSELSGVPIYAEDGSRLGIPMDHQVGDILHVRIEALETPFSDMQLKLGSKVVRHEQVEAVMAELREAQRTGRTVMGRILNPLNRGYAVGVGGLVCFCPLTQCMYQTAARVGVLQPFKVKMINEEKRNIVVQDAARAEGAFSRPFHTDGQPMQTTGTGRRFAKYKPKKFQPPVFQSKPKEQQQQ